MARPENEPKTLLGKRLRDVRRHFGEEDRELFAARLGFSKAALAYYERGERAPDSNVLAAYRDVLGVNVNWLLSGGGAMLDDPAKAPPQTVDPFLLEKLAKLASAIYRDAGIKLPGERITVEAAALYNDLVAIVGNVADAEEIDATLPLLRHKLTKRLKDAVAEPGAGKRSA